MKALPGLDWSRVLGIGVVMPGRLAWRAFLRPGRPLSTAGRVDVASELERISGLPVTTENDATVAAIGERFHGWRAS